jgi:putative membrane protein
VLSRAEAERLRAAVFERMTGPAADSAPAATDAPRAPETQVIRRLNLRELVLEGLTSSRVASVLVVLAVAWQYLDDLLPKTTYERLLRNMAEGFARWTERAGEQVWLQAALIILGVALASVLLSVIGAVIAFHGFTLSRRGEDLHRSWGLLTRRSSSLPRRRIQVLKIEEQLLRRWLKLATIRADTAGGAATRQEGKEGRDVLLPLARRDELERLLPEFFPDLEPTGDDWRQVSRRAIRRGTVKGTVVLALLAGALFAVQRQWYDLWPLALTPLVYWLNVVSYRRLGYHSGANYFRTRRGWLDRATHIVPIRNAQAIVLRQTPLDRHHRVGTLLVDTAGQAYTGGGPRIQNVPWPEALALARTLAQRAAATRYRWR